MDWLDGRILFGAVLLFARIASCHLRSCRSRAPLILNRDPRQVRCLYYEVSKALRGHGNSKAALDMALWDLAA
jgi:L-alanine-DL-glutamate epimerase-like enolase superfamily enzyme